MKNKSTFLLSNRPARVIVISILGVSSVVACGWGFWTDHSVRFNSERTGRAFYRLPPLPLSYDPVIGKEIAADEYENFPEWDNSYYEKQEEILAAPSKVWEQAMDAVDTGDLSFVGTELNYYLEKTRHAFTDNGEQQMRRNVAVDILDVLEERKKGASEKSVLAYIEARIKHFNWAEEGPEKVLSEKGTYDRLRLEDNWEYLRSAILYGSGRKEEALDAFRSHVRNFPNSEKNEPAKYMIGRILLEKSHSFKEARCGIQGEKTWGGQLEPSDIEDPAKCRDENWKAAMDQFLLLRKNYPNGRHFYDASGWIAFLHKRGDERAEALAEYYRLLGQTKDAPWRLEAKKSLQIIGHEYDDATLDKVEALIANEPDAALAYAYHRIYNHAVDLSYTQFHEWCCYGDDRRSQENAERQRVARDLEKGRHELERVARFAKTVVGKFGISRLSGDFLLRLSQANLELENFREAHTNAEKALRSGVTGNSRAEALWIKGSSDHQQKNFDSARATFSRLVAEFPDHKLTEGARRLLAITAEDQGDLEFALDQYIALDYKYDVAYFVDVLMQTDRLAKYVESRSKTPKYNELLYALGIRYMRDRRWNEARETLKMVETKPETKQEEDDYYQYDPESASPKFPTWNDIGQKMFIRDSWVLTDLKTIESLESLEKQVDEAVDDETKAEAMYQLASFYYEGGSLLLYNSAAWDGARYPVLSQFNGSGTMRLPNESRLLFEYSESHDNFARAIPIFLEVVDSFPNTKAAKDALYSAAVAHVRLSAMNPYWRDTYGKGLFAGPRLVDYKDVQRKYPNYQLPRGTNGWEPSTRTVNGGPGWAPKPKPLPKLTTEQRVVRKLGKWKGEYGPWVGENASWAWSGIKGAAMSVSAATAGYLQNYFYLVFAGFMGAIFWQSRKEIYEGPVTKGALLAHRGLLFIARHFRQRWVDVAVPSIVDRHKLADPPTRDPG